MKKINLFVKIKKKIIICLLFVFLIFPILGNVLPEKIIQNTEEQEIKDSNLGLTGDITGGQDTGDLDGNLFLSPKEQRGLEAATFATVIGQAPTTGNLIGDFFSTLAQTGPASLATYKEKQNIKTLLTTTEEIYKNSQGRDEAEKIKYYIKSSIEKFGIKSVLLVGGKDGQSSKWTLPVRYSHVIIRKGTQERIEPTF